NISWNWNSGMASPDGKRPQTAKSAVRLLLSEAVELDDLGGRILGLRVALGRLGASLGLGLAGRRCAERRALVRSRQRRRRRAARLVGRCTRLVLAVELQAEADRRIDEGRQ